MDSSLASINWGSAAEWVTGLITAAAFVFTVWQLSQERKQRHKAEREAQASGVAAWFDRETNCFIIHNQSGAVIYDVLVALVKAGRESEGEEFVGEYSRLLPVVPPGTKKVNCPGGWGGMSFIPSVDISFRDANGKHWFRSNYGKLTERKEDVFTFYNLPTPYNYSD